MIDVLVDARSLSGLSRYRGVGSYASGLIGRLPAAAQRRGIRLGLLATGPQGLPESARDLPRIAGHRSLPERLAGYEDAVRLTGVLRAAAPRVYHGLEYGLPLSFSGRAVLTVHDLIPWVVRDGYGKQRARWLLQANLARSADLLLTVSEHTRRDVLERWGVPPGRVVTTLSGVDHALFRPASPEVVDRALRAHGIDRPYFLYVGEFDRRKDPGTAIRAVRQINDEGAGVDLLLVGRNEPYRDALEAEFGQLRSGPVRFIGHVPLEGLVGLYGGAVALVFPSRYEGFGLPVLEAMACGCPVIARDGHAMPEVAGRAALLVEGDAGSFADAARSVWSDPGRRAELVARGLEHARAFTWERTAEQVVAQYERLLA
ncbi:MAG: glycosyltransferase family 4 protein [Candidatus Dormibacteria bacterium]